MADTEGAVGSLITLVVGVGISILLLIFVGSLGGSAYNIVDDDINSIGTSIAVVNESFVVNNVTATSLANSHIISVSGILNRSSNKKINPGNFTVNLLAGSILLTGDTDLNGSTAGINYTYRNSTIRNAISNSIVSSFQGLETTGDYLPIIVLAVVISLVLGLVLMMGIGTGRKGGGMAL